MQENTPDPVDIASNVTAIATKAAEDAQRKKARPKQIKNADGTWPEPDCKECGEEIGIDRLEAVGANTCIECATKLEKLGKQFRKG